MVYVTGFDEIVIGNPYNIKAIKVDDDTWEYRQVIFSEDKVILEQGQISEDKLAEIASTAYYEGVQIVADGEMMVIRM